MKVLITGGPVHAYLDAVKIITNRFRGGLMAELADDFLRMGVDVSYLCAPKMGAKLPPPSTYLNIIEHNGFEDYQRLVLENALRVDAVILGATVANLIPVQTIKGKFPSHNYQPGDRIPIDFTIAPRVIDRVKKINPRTHVFGFKLLSNASHEELIRATYGIVCEAHATAVFANDTKNLKQKYAVTKERGVHAVTQSELAKWIRNTITDMYYYTTQTREENIPNDKLTRIRNLIQTFSIRFMTVESGVVFGTVAIRCPEGFLTTGRGKHELDTVVQVRKVDHEKKEVIVGGHIKASLNAPLLARIFENPEVEYIVHYHEQESGIPTQPYAPPGTKRDTNRDIKTSFNIQEHGCMLFFNKEGGRI